MQYNGFHLFFRFLTTGDSYRTIALNYRMGEATVRKIVYEVCETIWTRLSPIFMPKPTVEMWKSIENAFSEKWNFPNCIGALDGKHVVIEAPPNSGSLYFNYKKTFSVVLMALVDADYRFIAVDVGAYGKNSDAGIFAKCNFGKALNEGNLNVPNDKLPPGSDDPLPYVIVGDEAFPLKRNIMRPYPGAQIGNDETKKILNYRLSRARRVSENAFGIWVQKFRIYNRRIKMSAEHVDKVILATCCLHNFLLYDEIGTIGHSDDNDLDAVNDLDNVGGACSVQEAMNVREKFRSYFVSPAGTVPWQRDMVRLGRRND